jgi:hypothetical protein
MIFFRMTLTPAVPVVGVIWEMVNSFKIHLARTPKPVLLFIPLEG